MIRSLIAALALAVPSLAAAQDHDFSATSEARSWNLAFEVPARFEATVVDLLCEVAGDCANQCADGRQLGLLRSLDGELVYPNKNGQPNFAGASLELRPYCGQMVEVDGLMIEDEYVGAHNVYLVQRILPEGASEWVRANSFSTVWAENNPDHGGSGPWFRRDPRVLALLQADGRGYLGIGLSQEDAWDATR